MVIVVTAAASFLLMLACALMIHGLARFATRNAAPEKPESALDVMTRDVLAQAERALRDRTLILEARRRVRDSIEHPKD